MKTVTINLKRPFAKQRAIIEDKTRFKVLAIGRRWGKTEALKHDMVEGLLTGQHMWFCSPTNKNNKRVYPQIKSVVRRIPGVYTNDTDMLIRFPSGGFVQFISLNVPDNLRGEGLDRVYVDEAAFVKDGVWDNVLRPMILTTKGSAIFSSSPNGTGNDFHTFFLRGLDPDRHDWATYHLPSGSSPFVPQSELDEIQSETTERVFQQEYLAEFLDGGGAVFRNLKACIVDNPKRTGAVVFGVDWGKENDYTVITVMDRNTGHVLEIDRFNQIGWSLQRGRLRALYDRWKPDAVWAESNSIGGPNIDALIQEGLPMRSFQTTAKSKPPLIESLVLAFEKEQIGIPDDPYLMGELKAYTMRKTTADNYKYSAPDGLHDDMVISLALANYGVEVGSMILFSTD